MRYGYHDPFNTFQLTSEMIDDLKKRQETQTFPPVNILSKNDGSNVLIEMAVAGFNPEDIKIEEEENKITISAEKKENQHDESWTFTTKEIATRAFTRSWTKKANYTCEQASFKNGMLVILMKRIQENVRQIEILNCDN